MPSPADPLTDQLFDERILYLAGEIDDAVAHRVSAQLLLLAAADPQRDITLYVGSPSGSVTAGLAIYDTMQLVTPDVATWAVGLTASVGQFLLTAGAPGKRHALPHARIVTSRPSAGPGLRAEMFADLKREIAELTARHTGRPVEEITADADRDRWFDATAARDHGLVDHVATRTEQTGPRIGFSPKTRGNPPG